MNNNSNNSTMYQQQYTQIQGYKHLLQVAQNIMYSSQIDQQILQKYQQLKTSIHHKISPSIIKSSSADTFYIQLLSTYRLLIDNSVKVIQSFEEELQDQMQRQHYNHILIDLNSKFLQKIHDLQTSIEYSSNSSSNYYTKSKLLHKQQLNTLKYSHDQLNSKFQNLGLLIQVHKKMHQIILQATKTQQKKLNNQDKLKQKIYHLQQQLNQTTDVNAFIQQHKLTQQNYSQFIIASKALKKILFSNQFK